MNINRNNYERFFLLYADNELSDAEKNMVNLFVQQNTDLEEEFLMIQQSVVSPDKNLTLGDKNFLLRQEQTLISEDNYEEIFILYNDGQLDEHEKRQTVNFINQHPEFENQFRVLQNVKLEADPAIVFPDKRSLLKKEGKGKVIPLNLRRALVAAVILGFGLWAGFNYMQTGKVTPVVSSKQIAPATSPETESQQPLALNKPGETTIKSGVHTDKNDNNNRQGQEISKKSLVKNSQRQQRNVHEATEQIVKNSHQQKSPVSILKTIEHPKDEVVMKEPVSDKNIIAKQNNPVPVNTNETTTDKMISVKPESENYAVPASYRTDAKNDNYVFYNVSEDQFKKTKLFGLLKKVKRVIERKSPFNHNNDKAELAVN
jgi:hypothetical protein